MLVGGVFACAVLVTQVVLRQARDPEPKLQGVLG
jgi:hypothetical protein